MYKRQEQNREVEMSGVKGLGSTRDVVPRIVIIIIMSYSFLGPAIKADKRVSWRNVGIISLEEATKEHDIWYKYQKKMEGMWVADKE